MVSQVSSKLLPPSPSCPPSSSSSPDRSPLIGGSNGGVSYIRHTVSKFDTLAGVAIKYGVDVADIKRINGLVTDLQMFALKTLNIPLPGRHPPSPVLSDCFDSQGTSTSEQTPPSRRLSDLFDSFQSLKLKSSPPQKVSAAMSSLQNYYGLRPGDDKASSEGLEMAVYRKEGSHYLEDGPFVKPLPLSARSLNNKRKSKSAANGFMQENGDLVSEASVADAGDSNLENWIDSLVRRHQKSEADFCSQAPEMLLKEENSSGVYSSITGKGLALRPKAASRTTSAADTEIVGQNTVSCGLGDSPVPVDDIGAVRKSSSTPILQDSDNGSYSSIWPSSKWSLKPDLQAFSNAGITIPIFDGLPKHLTGRRNKAALD